MSKLATAIILAFLVSASIVIAQEHWVGNDIIFDGKTHYKVYGWGHNPDGGFIYGVRRCTKEGQLLEPDVVIRSDISPPGTKGIQVVSGPSMAGGIPPEDEYPEEKAFGAGKPPSELTDQAQKTTSQAEARAKEPEGPQLTTYPGVEGQFYEATIIHDDLLEIYNTYAVLDREGNIHYLEMQSDGKYKEVPLNIKESDQEYFSNEYGSKIEDVKSQTPWLPRFFGETISFYRQYSGLAGWSSLIFDKEFLQKWKDTVNKLMCDYTLIAGKECWTSKICTMYSDIEPSRDGILYTAPIGGVPLAIANIEAQRSLPFITPNETMWVYTVTFGLSNPYEDEAMTYNIAFNGPTRSALWWSEPQYLPEKGSVSAIGAAALMKLSPHDYTEVCIQFDPSIDTFDGKRKDHMCNPVVQYTGGATAPYGMKADTALALPGSQPQQAPGANV